MVRVHVSRQIPLIQSGTTFELILWLAQKLQLLQNAIVGLLKRAAHFNRCFESVGVQDSCNDPKALHI